MRHLTISLGLILAFFLLNCQDQKPTAVTSSPQELAQAYCSSCHLFPEPSVLDKASWENYILPRMGYRLGIYPPGFDRSSLLEEGLAGQIVEAAKIYPETPVLSKEEWTAIQQFYLNNAPGELPLSAVPERQNLSGKKAQFAPFFSSPPATSLLRYTSSNLIAVGEADKNSVLLLDQEFNVQTQLPVKEGPVDIEESSQGIFITCMGSFSPTDAPNGAIVYFDFKEQKNPVLIDSLQRPVQTELVDLNGDGLEDLVICEFGKWTGRLAWWEQQADGQFTPHVLMNRPGAIAVLSRDLDQDGDVDLLGLFGQGDEGIWAFYNDGNGMFSTKNILQFPSSYGSSFLEWTDWNGDEYPDLIYCAGDNADFPPIVKPYHGIRIFQGQADGNFEEVFFYPFPGAYAAKLHDYDQDGDKDIAAISFFPYFANRPYRSFIFLDNQGDGQWKEKHIPQAESGRWIIMDLGDPDEDQQVDLLLGALTFEVVPDNGEVKRWVKNGLPFIQLSF